MARGDIKRYEMDSVGLVFIPDGSPMEGTLAIEYPEHVSFTTHVSLAKSRSRKQYAAEASEHSGVDGQHLEKLLVDLCTKRFEEVEAAVASPDEDGEGEPLPEIGQDEIDALLGKPGVLGRLVGAAETFSKAVGEGDLLKLLALVFVSAQLTLLPSGKPLGVSLVLTAPPGRGKNFLADAVARVLPNEFCYLFEASSPKALYYLAKRDGPACLKHRILYPNEAEAVDPLVETFRPMLSGGGAKLVTVGKNGGEENAVQEIELEGPMGLVVPTVRNKLDKQLQSRMLIADLGDYAGRVAAHSGEVSAQLAPDYAGTDHTRELSIWHAALKSLTGTRKVVVPFHHEGFRFDSDTVAHGARLWTNFLALMCAHAWLEQRNRETMVLDNGEGAIVADAEDYAAAYEVFERTCERSVVNISDAHRKILDALHALREEEGPFVGFPQRRIAERSGVPQSTVSDNRAFLTKSLRLVWEPEGGGLALVHDAEPAWWEKGDALIGFPRPEAVRGWWGRAE